MIRWFCLKSQIRERITEVQSEEYCQVENYLDIRVAAEHITEQANQEGSQPKLKCSIHTPQKFKTYSDKQGERKQQSQHT